METAQYMQACNFKTCTQQSKYSGSALYLHTCFYSLLSKVFPTVIYIVTN